MTGLGELIPVVGVKAACAALDFPRASFYRSRGLGISRASSPAPKAAPARALAAVCPPLKTADVVQAADSLAAHAEPTRVIGHLLRHGADLMKVRGLVEALRALRDVAA